MDEPPSSWEMVKRAVKKLKGELWNSDKGLFDQAKEFMRSSQLHQFQDLEKLMTVYHPRKTSTKQWVGIGVWTLFFTCAPLIFLARKSWFSAFCAFHVKVLRLKNRGPAGLAGLAMLMSLVYSSVALPVYLGGVCLIIGAKSGKELRSTIYDSIWQKYDFDYNILDDPNSQLSPEQREKIKKNKETLKVFDEVMVFGLDQSCGIEGEKTAKFLEDKFRRN